jgi:dolichol kinase
MNRIQWRRKLFHFSGIVIPFVYLASDKKYALSVAITFFALAVLIEMLRMKGLIKSRILDSLLKEREKKALTGSLYYLGASLLVILVFRKPIAIASLLVLCISDPIASIVGISIGRVPCFGKSAEGCLAFFFSSLAILASFHFSFSASLAAAMATSFAELFSAKILDDNFSIPVACAIVLTVAGWL